MRIRVQPGTLPGNGAGATATPVLQNIGATGRPYRILVVPRDGAFSIGHSASARIHNVKGVTFLGFCPWPLGASYESASGIVLTTCTDVAWAWSKTKIFNITTTASISDGIEFIECTSPEQALYAEDRCANRNASSGALYRVTYDGCWWAPNYKPAGSSSHCDTLQMSGSTGTFDTFLFRDCAIFGSTNAAVISTGDGSDIPATSRNFTYDHSLIAASNRGINVYPITPEANQFTSGYPVAINAKPWGCIAIDSLIMGKIVPTFQSVANTRVISAQPAPSSGSWIIDASIGSDTAWFTANAPKPTDVFLQSIWAW